MVTLDDIFGQSHAIDVLRRAYPADRLPHGSPLVFQELAATLQP